ncbi:MAG: hypothetical protein MJY74_08090 [Bacteroidaceae bacterium]|nr:hypothetical protein [Bacteroidaceae bacterium]
MKTTIRTILCAAAVVIAAISCQKSIDPANPAEEGKGTIDICVNGLMGEYTQQDGVKSSLVNNVRVAWATGDVVYVFDGSKYLGKLTAALDKKADEDRYAKLGGTISAPATTPCVLSLVHSSLMTEPAAGAEVSELSIDMSAQSTATVPFVAYATLEYTGTTITDVVPFQFATSVIKVNCTGLKANTAITSATLSNVNTECKLTLSGTSAPTVSGDTNGTITRAGNSYFAAVKVNDEGEAVFQIAVPVLETATGERVLTIEQGSDEVKDKKFTTNSLDAATSVNTICQLVRLPAGAPAGALPGVFSVSADKKVYFSQGNLWYGKVGDAQTATFNFEANQYSFAGSWDASHVSHFTWSSTVEAAVGNNSGGYLFCDESHKVSVDGGEAIYYALSKDEWTYLFNNHSKKLASVNGVNGYVIAPDNVTLQAKKTSYTATELNDANLVFLPAAGFRYGSDVYDVGDDGYYWSSTAIGSNYAYLVLFDSPYVYPDYSGGRALGCSVRLVTDASVTPAPTPTNTGTAKATIGGSQVDVNWIQLWADGPKFAEYNVGVTDGNAESYGEYYTWGGNQDVQGVESPTYKSGTDPLTGADDTATNLWGGNWRMPTKAEFENLLSNCNVVWTTVNGKSGRKFTGKGAYASNSVFLPAAGFCLVGDVLNQGKDGNYWSSTPNGSPYYMCFGSGYQYVDINGRSLGCSVRAVLAE